MRARSRSALFVLPLLLVSGCGLTGGEQPRFKAAYQAPVALGTVAKTPIHVGLIVSPTSPEGEGRDVAPGAAGARVAELRFNQGGRKVVLDVQDDHGTAAGAVAAVKVLVARQVAGIVYASEGRHLLSGLAAAAAAKVPVLLPYADVPPGATGAWSTGPTTDQVERAIQARLSSEGLGTPYQLPLGVARVPALTNSAIVPAATKVISVRGTATQSATAVEGLQSRQIALPVVLGPSVLSPVFAEKLASDARQSGATSASGRYLTAGIPTSLESAGTAGFAAAARLAASDARVLSVTSAAPFGDRGAAIADTRSHDAVVALVRAAEASPAGAGSVLRQLPTLVLRSRDGLAGPRLSFSTTKAVADQDVKPLQASLQTDGSRLSWFALPPVSGTP